MKILSLEYQDADGWTLEPMKLSGFNLLVGVSGAGKTRIVQAIERVCALALGKTIFGSRGATFTIELEHDGCPWRWEADFGLTADPLDVLAVPASMVRIRSERIERDEKPFVERTSDRFVFDKQELPRLTRTNSAIVTLREEPAMAPLATAFSRCVYRVLNVQPFVASELPDPPVKYDSVDRLGADFSLPLLNKALLLSEQFPEAFSGVQEAFRDAFPSVEKLMATRDIRPWPDVLPKLEAIEAGTVIPFVVLSSGMQRYLSFLIHLSFAPRGTVVLIDELEASFGINCLPAATDFLMSRAPDLQLILTSHHPYIIEQIPMRHWKVVTRKGSRVRVLDSADIPALQKSSHLDAFLRLINLPEYNQGIQA